MFHLYDFLIYCFITAYTPGANNLLSMSNAIRLGLRRSIRFNLGILAGFAIVMSVCTAFSATLYSFPVSVSYTHLHNPGKDEFSGEDISGSDRVKPAF